MYANRKDKKLRVRQTLVESFGPNMIRLKWRRCICIPETTFSEMESSISRELLLRTETLDLINISLNLLNSTKNLIDLKFSILK